MNAIDNKILDALNNINYRARTIKGISDSTGEDIKIVIGRIKQSVDLDKKVKIFPLKSKKGEVLFTTKVRFEQTATISEKFIDAFASNKVRFTDEY